MANLNAAIRWRRSVTNLSSGPFPSGLKWSPDGRSVTYIDNSSTASNIVSQPIDGSPSKPLTRFKSDRISSFAWSHDGKQLFLGRGAQLDDVVLIKDFR